MVRTVVTKDCHIVQVCLIQVVNLSQSVTVLLVLLIQTVIMNLSRSLIARSVLTVTHNRQVLLPVIVPQHSRMIMAHSIDIIPLLIVWIQVPMIPRRVILQLQKCGQKVNHLVQMMQQTQWPTHQ